MVPLLAAAAPIIGSVIDAFSGNAAAEKNAAAQKEFAQNGIQWKVEDSKKAGISPIYGLGAQTMSFQPSFVGTNFAQAGQDVSRAVMATQDSATRGAVSGLALERAHLENDLLRAQILKTTASIGPPMPTATANPWLIDGQGNTAFPDPRLASLYVNDTPMKRNMSAPGAPWAEAGALPDVGYARTSQGGYAPVPGEQVAERMEDNWMASLAWMFRNQMLPSFGFNQTPPPVGVPPGYDAWIYNPFMQQYTPHKKGRFFYY